ncbi:MAG: hypothetical protein JSU74_05070, partial [Candidatus Zixiibacteriota bacterium]
GGTGSFTVEAKYSFFRSYPGGNAIYLIRIEPGPDFSGDATVNVSSDRLIKTELTSTHLNAESPMTELVLDPSKQLDFGFYYVTVTVSNQTYQESVELEVEMYNWGILSMNHAVTARERFIDWLETEHPELGNFGGEKWKVYSHYPLMEVEHYTHLSDNWEFRVCCHVTWNPQDYYEALWIRPRGQWDPILTAKFAWDEASQSQIIYETPLEDWNYYYGY